jgi:hypothetical protein
MIRIGLFGQMGNGKSTAAMMIRDKILSYKSIKIISFAQPIYETLATLTDHPISWLKANKNIKLANGEITIRESLQQLGSLGRKIDKNVFVNKLLRDNGGNYVVEDGRHENEMVELRRSGAVNILIICPQHINNDPHESESWLRSMVDIAMRLTNTQINNSTCMDELGFNYTLIVDQGRLDLLQSKLTDVLLNHPF